MIILSIKVASIRVDMCPRVQLSVKSKNSPRHDVLHHFYWNISICLPSCVRPRRIEFTTENNKRILRPRTNIAPDTNYQLNPCFVSNLILPNPKFYCINNKFYDHGAARAQKAREQKIIWRLLKWHSTPSPAPVPPAGRLEHRADVIKNGVELRLRGPLSRPLRMAKWYKWRGGAMKCSRGLPPTLRAAIATAARRPSRKACCLK